MAMETLDELLKSSSAKDAQHEGYYSTLRDSTDNNQVRLLTYCLARHCRHQSRELSRLDAATRDQLGEIRIELCTTLAQHELLDARDSPTADITGTELLAAAIERGRRRIAWYAAIMERQLPTPVHTFLESLVERGRRDITLLKQMQTMGYF